ncbi:putative phenylacetate-CoA ligase [Pseudodesulfovibrio mercurii]|uniref:Putative phenylacetate-CoA ligase n=2 Tax=Pseudodesulfovibrio mercurii TaxID=641491 RepID=F0JFE1_9BACT|nr:putative phenylacetate-CoA ligase [Pseudodesulfovibrio mercurii]
MDSYAQFLASSADDRLVLIKSAPDGYWQERSERMALDLFRRCAARVPAYRDFLHRNGVDPAAIRGMDDFARIPATDKENYINHYPVDQLCWDGELGRSRLIASSSGSTGTPCFWPAFDEQTRHTAEAWELLFRDFLEVRNRSTLFIVAFAMGLWAAGTSTMMANEWISRKGYPLTLATPGIHIPDVLALVRSMHDRFDQIVIAGYPPHVKTIIDAGIRDDLDWKRLKLRFVFTGEAFTERWRTRFAEQTGLDNILTDALNMYGSADIGMVAHETPLTICLRRMAAEDDSLATALFGSDRVPAVNQYNPETRYFETVDGRLVVTAPSGIPLVRYNTRDIGGTLTYGDLETRLSALGIGLQAKTEALGIAQRIWKTPLVYLFGRGKFAASIYGITIFPEYTKWILDAPELTRVLTGKFVITTEDTDDLRQQLRLRVELAEGVEPTGRTRDLVKSVFVRELPRISSEYRALLQDMGDRVHPAIDLHPFGDPEHFPKDIVKKGA